MKKSQDELYFDVIRALVAASIEGMVIDSLEMKMPVKEIPGRSGWIERMPTGWRELKITLRPKIKLDAGLMNFPTGSKFREKMSERESSSS